MGIDVGHVVAGKYELCRLLGRGSMGEVWIAHHRSLDEKLALKLMAVPADATPDDRLEDPATAAMRFQFEAQVAARLSKKTRHIVRVTDHGQDGELAYLAMELLEGETLEDRLVRDRVVPPPTVATIVTHVARALAQAHVEGILHRDLKPANIFLTKDEDGRVLVKLLDFGIARFIHKHKVRTAFSTAAGLVFGTPCYMSPEQARNSPLLDAHCDAWALAAVAYEALTGELPVDGKDTDELLQKLIAGRVTPLRERAPIFPQALDAVFRRAFAPSVAGRYQSATELARAIEEAIEGISATGPSGEAPSPSAEAPVPRLALVADNATSTARVKGRRRRARAGVVLALAGLATAGGALALHAALRPTAVAATTPAPPRAEPAAVPGTETTASAPTLAPQSDVPTVAVSALPAVPAVTTGSRATPSKPPRTATGGAASPTPAERALHPEFGGRR
jgi:eukaryotic-like serine/threonine-protein kinase